jgi:hypothetical protein
VQGLISVAKSGFEPDSWGDVFRLLAGEEFSKPVDVWVRPSSSGPPGQNDLIFAIDDRVPDARDASIRGAAIKVGSGLIRSAVRSGQLTAFTGHHDGMFLVRIPEHHWYRSSEFGTVPSGAGLDDYAGCPIVFSRPEVRSWAEGGARLAFERGVRPDVDDTLLERMHQLIQLHGWTIHRAAQDVAPAGERGAAKGDSIRRRLQDKYGVRFKRK